MPAIIEKIESDVDPYSFERDSEASRRIKLWKIGAPFNERPADSFVVDPQVVEQESRAFKDRILGGCFSDLEVEIHGERMHGFKRRKKHVKGTARYARDYWFSVFEALFLAHRRHTIVTRLEAAAKAGNEAVFLATLKEVDWRERPASEYIRIIDLALEAGAHLAARNLSAQGADAHPDNAELQKYARVLAPPRVVANRAPRNVNVAANVEWLNANNDAYKDKCVAVKDGTLLGASYSHKELITQIGETKGRGILVTKIY